jgi:hypothetical protein
MPSKDFDFDVISQPAMPPPPPQPAAESPGLAKSADPRHNAARGDQR